MSKSVCDKESHYMLPNTQSAFVAGYKLHEDWYLQVNCAETKLPTATEVHTL
jgi:hypothetical protein